jgi:hypothetical protein
VVEMTRGAVALVSHARLSLAAFATLLFFLVSLSCAPKQKGGVIGREAGPGPSELTAQAGNGSAELRWKTNRGPDAVVLGYNIYVSDSPILSGPNDAELPSGIRPFNDSPYPGDTDPSTDYETYQLSSLSNGESYYVVVTTAYPGPVESRPSNQVEVIPRPQGNFTLTTSLSGDESGYSFREQKTVPSDDLANDLYLADIGGKLYVASPNRISSVLRSTRFYKLGKTGELGDVRIVELKMRGEDKLQAAPGEIFLLQDANDCYALAKFDSVDDSAGSVRISFIYQTRPKALTF